jgi:hypothetical protein
MLHLFNQLFGTQVKGKRAPVRRPIRLGLETLDERVLPSVSSLGDATGFYYGNQYASSDRTVARSTSTGNYAVTFQGTNYGGNGIYVRLFNAAGTPLTGPIHVGSTTSAGDYSPSITMNAGGQFAVAWTHRYSSSDLDVHVQRFNANGTPSGPEIWAAASTHNEYEPSAALDNYGNLMVAYTYDYSSTDQDIYVWTQRASGATNTFVLANSTHNEHAPSLAVNAYGVGVVAYEYDYSSSDHDIYAQRVYTGGYYGSYGYAYGSVIYVNTSTAYQYDPSAAINTSGTFVVSYTELQNSGGPQVFARQFSSSNSFQGQVSVGSPSDTRGEYSSSVAIDNYGRFIVAYTHAYSSTDLDVLAEVFNSDNTIRDYSFYVAGSTAYEYSPTVALGVTDLTSNYSGNGFYDGQAVFAFQVYGVKPTGYGYNGTGVSAALGYNL